MTPAEFVSGRWDEYIERFSAGWMKELILKIGVENINQTDIIDYWKSHDV